MHEPQFDEDVRRPDHDAPFFYRFTKPAGTVYGPRTLEWIGSAYNNRPDCSCCPADAEGQAPNGDWRSVEAWICRMKPAPLTATQASRLRKLGVPFDETSTTRDGARTLIREAERSLPPTLKQVREAATLKVHVPERATRGEVEMLIDGKRRGKAVASLGRAGRVLGTDAPWEQIREVAKAKEDDASRATLIRIIESRGIAVEPDFDNARLSEIVQLADDLREAIREAKGAGYHFARSAPLLPEELPHLIAALWRLEETVARARANAEWFVHIRRIPRKPTKAELDSVLDQLVERLVAGSWKGDADDECWLLGLALQ